ncbi:hypothetical protein JW933_02845, partial [candidate division FCPU426 bacterium]|nr:hypothetical protein [candidate division FCPU426 bacterium]
GDKLTTLTLACDLCRIANNSVQPQAVPLAAIAAYGWTAEFFGLFGLDLGFSMDKRNLCGIYWWGDCSRARREIGFSPRYTHLEVMERTISWYAGQRLGPC